MKTREIIRWLQPWPIILPRAKEWTLSITSLREASELKVFWPVNGIHKTARWWADKCHSQTAPQEQHYIYSIATDRMPVARSLTVIVMPWRGGEEVVVDGNHHLIAALLAKRWGKCSLRGVGVIRKESDK